MNITENAPAVLLFNLAEGLTVAEKDRLAELQAMTPKTSEEKAEVKLELEALLLKRSAPNETMGFSGWVPVPLIGSDVLPFLPESYNTNVVKRVETIGSEVVMSSTMMTSVINIKTKSSDIANSIINACQLLYSMDDNFARIAFFSPEMIVQSGVFLSMTRAMMPGQTGEQIISITVQNGTPKTNLLKQLLNVKDDPKELVDVGELITGNSLVLQSASIQQEKTENYNWYGTVSVSEVQSKGVPQLNDGEYLLLSKDATVCVSDADILDDSLMDVSFVYDGVFLPAYKDGSIFTTHDSMYATLQSGDDVYIGILKDED